MRFPDSLIFLLWKNKNMAAPKAIIKNEYSATFRPIKKAVTVVPIFAPIMMPMDCLNVIKPAEIKPMTMTVVADED